MLFDYTIVGFGVIGAETLNGFKRVLINKKRKNNIKIAVIEKDLKNIPGGIAYSEINSKFGYFNNPLRLSHPDFIRWFKLKKNRKSIIDFAIKNSDYNLDNWLKNNNQILSKRFQDYNEIYLPRLIYSFFLKEKIINFLNLKRKLKISLRFYKGEANNIKNENKYCVFSKNYFKQFNLKYHQNNLIIKKINSNLQKKICSKKLIIGTGIVPPKKISVINNNQNSNYIWDFYSTGGTYNLIKIIKRSLKNKKKLNIVFIGNKAGLLETMQELERLIIYKKNNIKLICISKNSLTLQKAEPSKNFYSFKLQFFSRKNIKKIKKASQILELLKKEFRMAKLKNFNKYDVWTNIMKKNFMSICYKQLNLNEKKIYNLDIFPLIREITRYTFPETVNSKNRLLRQKKIKFIKGRVNKIIKNKNDIILKTFSNKSIKGDIVINVSGPVSILENSNEVKIISSLKKISNKFNSRGFSSNSKFMLEKGLYLPGTLSNNFNPARETIIKAVTKNTHKMVKSFY